MTKLDKNKVGLTLAIFFAAMHALWALAVALGVGQKFFDYVFPMHFLNNVYSVMAFNAGTAVLLVVMAFVCCYIMGWLFAALWNWVDKTV